MKIVVKAEKAGQPLAQFEYQVETEDKPHKSAGKAVAQFCKGHPGVHLFDEDVRLGASEIFPSRRGQNQLIRRQVGNGTSELGVLKL